LPNTETNVRDQKPDGSGIAEQLGPDIRIRIGDAVLPLPVTTSVWWDADCP